MLCACDVQQLLLCLSSAILKDHNYSPEQAKVHTQPNHFCLLTTTRNCCCAAGEGINIDESNELFSLAALKGKGNLAEQADVPAPTQEEMEAIAASSDDEAASMHSSDDSDDSDDDARWV